MSIENAVAVACEYSERPDLDLSNPYVFSVTKGALIDLHGLSNFARDLKVISQDLANTDCANVLTLPSNWRKYHSTILVDSTGEDLCIPEFRKSYIHKKPKNYFNVAYTNYYVEIGNELRTYWPSMQSQSALNISYFSYPTLTYNSADSTYTADSWILEKYEHLVAAKIAQSLAGYAGSDLMTEAARVVDTHGYNLINNEEIA